MNAQHGRLARQQARRHKRERLAGIVLAVIGVVVLVVAIIALRDPKNTGTPAAGGSSTPAASTSTSTIRPTPSSSAATGGTSAPPLNLGSSSASRQSQSDTQLRADVPLVVLNNTTISGLAAQAAQTFENGGWTVSDTGNLTNNIISTCAYYDPSVNDAQAAARALRRQYPTIKRVEPKFDGLVDGPVVVVLTPDYSSG